MKIVLFSLFLLFSPLANATSITCDYQGPGAEFISKFDSNSMSLNQKIINEDGTVSDNQDVLSLQQVCGVSLDVKKQCAVREINKDNQYDFSLNCSGMGTFEVYLNETLNGQVTCAIKNQKMEPGLLINCKMN